MAERRMFSKQIIDSDPFLDLPMSTQCLYFHLAMRADDEGFLNNPKKIQRMVGASDDDMKLLLLKRFILAFDSGVVVIKHWRIHNYIRNDRFKPTVYEEEKAMLTTKPNGAYTLGIPSDRQLVYQMDTQDRIELELELDKDSKGKDITPAAPKKFTPPTLEEVTAYCQERGNGIDPQAFIDYYEARNWMLGKVKMKDWKAAVRTWERNSYNNGKKITAGDYKWSVQTIEDLKKAVERI